MPHAFMFGREREREREREKHVEREKTREREHESMHTCIEKARHSQRQIKYKTERQDRSARRGGIIERVKGGIKRDRNRERARAQEARRYFL